MDFKGKDVKIHYIERFKKHPALVEFSNTINIEKNGEKRELKKCKLFNLDGKALIEYEDTKIVLDGLAIKTTSHIACYKHFFVKEKESLKKVLGEDKKLNTSYHWAYQAYTYEGRALICAADLWIEDEDIINRINKMALDAEAEKE